MTSAPSGARPKFVCIKMPVPLITGWMRDADNVSERGADIGKHVFKIGDRLQRAQCRKFSPNGCHDGRSRQSSLPERLQDRIHGRNTAELEPFHD